MSLQTLWLPVPSIRLFKEWFLRRFLDSVCWYYMFLFSEFASIDPVAFNMYMFLVAEYFLYWSRSHIIIAVAVAYSCFPYVSTDSCRLLDSVCWYLYVPGCWVFLLLILSLLPIPMVSWFSLFAGLLYNADSMLRYFLRLFGVVLCFLIVLVLLFLLWCSDRFSRFIADYFQNCSWFLSVLSPCSSTFVKLS